MCVLSDYHERLKSEEWLAKNFYEVRLNSVNPSSTSRLPIV